MRKTFNTGQDRTDFEQHSAKTGKDTRETEQGSNDQINSMLLSTTNIEQDEVYV